MRFLQYIDRKVLSISKIKNKGKTKEEKILDDIETGLEILNSIFG